MTTAPKLHAVLFALCIAFLSVACAPDEPKPNQSVESSTSEMSKEMELALDSDDAEKVTALLDAGEALECTNEGGWAPIHFAAREPEGRCLRLLLDRGAQVDREKDDGVTALMLAASFGHTENVRLLLEHGADVRAETDSGSTALGMAAIFGHVEPARMLLDHGASVLKSATAETAPLYLAACGLSEHNAAMMKLLVDRIPDGVSVDSQTQGGQTPLEGAISSGNADAAKLLLRAGANPLSSSGDARLSLWKAVRMTGDPELVRILLDAGLDPAVRGVQAQTALHAAADIGSVAIVELLLEAGCDPNATDDVGNTPLHLVATRSDEGEKKGARDCVKLLLKHGADRTIKNKDGQTPLDVAYWLEVEMLLKDDGEG
ncbi:MAG: ankyrin repeat domain-containing protein [Planctomycetes bacterium]|nr:ankyrin repeat domain-containing protein [Planctomycetota bacterium]